MISFKDVGPVRNISRSSILLSDLRRFANKEKRKIKGKERVKERESERERAHARKRARE